MQNKPLVKQLVLVLAHGISSDLYKRKKDLLPNLKKLGTPAEVVALSATAKAG
jgi:hypothetical protein